MSAIAANTGAPIDHTPVAVSGEIPPAPAVDLPDLNEELGGPSAMGNMFGGLLPVAPRAAAPAANDDVAEVDDREPSNDVGATSDSHRGDAKRKLRRIVGPRLFRARELSGYSQTEAATAMGYKNPSQVSLWEMGRRMIPIFEIIKAANLYNVSVDYLLGETHDIDRDPMAGARHAILRGVRGMLSKMAELTVSEIDRHARLVGTDSGSTAQFITASTALLDAVHGLERLNRGAFDQMKGGATVVLKAEAFEQALHDAKLRQRRAQALDIDLRDRLGRLPDGDIECDLDAELVSDDEA